MACSLQSGMASKTLSSLGLRNDRLLLAVRNGKEDHGLGLEEGLVDDEVALPLKLDDVALLELAHVGVPQCLHLPPLQHVTH